MNRKTLFLIATLAIILAILTLGPASYADERLATDPEPNPNICYAVPDSGDKLVTINRITGSPVVNIGSNGVSNIEAIALAPDGVTLYAANGGTLGTLNTSNGSFSSIGNFGTGGGSAGNITFSDVDGLAFDVSTGVFYGTHRQSGDDLLFQINPATGAHVPNAFGSGIDYVKINTNAAVGVPDIDDIAVNPATGQMYASAGDGSNGANHRFVKVNKLTGAVTDVGQFHKSNGVKVEDMEGLTFFNDGTFYGTTGSQGNHSNRFWAIDASTAVVTEIAPFNYSGDYEAVACLTGGATSSIGDRVFQDNNGDGNQDAGESGLNGVTIKLYQGACPASGSPYRSAVTSGDGNYDFTQLPMGPYCVNVDESTLPPNAGLTTNNEPLTVNLGYQQDFNNADFGYAPVSELSIVKELVGDGNNSVELGDIVTFNIRVTNTGLSTMLSIPLRDVYDPDYLEYVDATPASNSDSLGLVTWNDLTASFGQDLGPGQSFDVQVRFRAIGITADAAPITAASVDAVTWNIEVWPQATCAGWAVEFDRVRSSDAENWRVKVDGVVIGQGVTNGSETVTGAWPAWIDLSETHTFTAEIYEGKWLGRSVTFGDCAFTGSIGDRVFNDINGSGLPDGGLEPGIGGVTVHLYQGNCPASGSAVRTDVTNSNGSYSFTNLPPGGYCVSVDDSTLPIGMLLTTNNEPLTVNLAANQHFADADFGYRLEPEVGTCDVATAHGVDAGNVTTREVSDNACVEITARVEVEITKLATSPVWYVGQESEFTIVITNTGNTTIDLLPLHDIYDTTYLEYLGSTPESDDNANDGLINWSDLTQASPKGFGANLPPGETFEVQVRFRALAATVDNTSLAAADSGASLASVSAQLLAPNWVIEVWPHATCAGWSVDFEGSNSKGEPWRVKVDGVIIDQGTTYGNETISGGWPAWVNLTTTHTFRAEIYEGDRWLGREASFGNCPVQRISLTKTPNMSIAVLGDTILYTYDVKNTGTETLSQIQLVDNKLGAISLGATTLAPGQSTSGAASYTVQLADVPGTIVNVATVTARTPSGAQVQDSDDASVRVEFPLELVTDKNAIPGVCEEATIELLVRGAGMGGGSRVPLDVMLVIDRSGSMDNYGSSGTPQPISDTKAAAKLLVDQLDSSMDRVGLVDYYEWATLKHSLSSNFGSVKSSIDNISVGGWTNIADGIFDAQAHLSANVRPDAVPIMVLLTDGVPTHKQDGTFCQDWPTSANACSQDTVAKATAAKNAGTTIYTIGVFSYMEVDHPQSAVLARSIMSQAASSPDTFYDAPSSSDLLGIFEEIANRVTNIAGTDVVVTDILPPGVNFVPGSANPPAQVSGQTLTWEFNKIGVDEEVTLRFAITLDNLVANQLVDVYPDSRVDYTDFRGESASTPFPETRMTPQGCPTIGDYVWNDANGDGIQNPGETGLGNVTLALRSDASGSPGAVIDTVATNNSGGYLFDFIRPGAYWVQVTDDLNITTGMQLTSGPQSKPNPFGPIVVGAAEVFDEADFGYQASNPDQTCDVARVVGAIDAFDNPVPPVSDFECITIRDLPGSIGDYVWNDANGNGIQDEGPGHGINGVTVKLYREGGDNVCSIADMIPANFVKSAVTAGDGEYDLTNLAPDVYCVNVEVTTMPGGYEFIPGLQSKTQPHRVDLALGEDYNDADFGYAGRGNITGVVFWDWNENGIQDLGEDGIPGVRVCLYQDVDRDRQFNDGIDLQISCQLSGNDPGSEGFYNFVNNLPGDDVVVQDPIPGLDSTTGRIRALTLIVIGATGS
ncbi:MAG: VWA domain-containing protein, partial [Caldilineales bacterium]|nr:VWA domain-containing protein [Caldilineales bacterium]